MLESRAAIKLRSRTDIQLSYHYIKNDKFGFMSCTRGVCVWVYSARWQFEWEFIMKSFGVDLFFHTLNYVSIKIGVITTENHSYSFCFRCCFLLSLCVCVCGVVKHAQSSQKVYNNCWLFGWNINTVMGENELLALTIWVVNARWFPDAHANKTAPWAMCG